MRMGTTKISVHFVGIPSLAISAGWFAVFAGISLRPVRSINMILNREQVERFIAYAKEKYAWWGNKGELYTYYDRELGNSDEAYTKGHWKRVHRLLKAMEEGRTKRVKLLENCSYDTETNLFSWGERVSWLGFHRFAIDGIALDKKGRFMGRKKKAKKKLPEPEKLKPINYGEDENIDLDSLPVGPVDRGIMVDVRNSESEPWEGPYELLARLSPYKDYTWWSRSESFRAYKYARLHQEPRVCDKCGQEVEG
jgi:hypothetical protein